MARTKDQGRDASKRAYRCLKTTREEIDAALVQMRAVDLDKTIYKEDVPNVIGQLEMFQKIAEAVIHRLVDMAYSDDWMGHRLGK